MTDSGPPVLGVGMIGYAFMGAVHSQAWRTAGRFFDLPCTPALTALAGRDAAGVHAAAQKMGWASTETDWRRLLDRDDVTLIDIGAHIIDLAQFVSGSAISGVSGLTETFVRERPLPAASSGLAASGGSGTGAVTVDDAALFFARFDSGALGSFEATRFASGRKNSMRLEVNGSDGSLAFDFEAMNELQFHDHTEDADTAGFR